MRTPFKWIAVSLVLFGACLFAFARFSTLSSDIQMHRLIEENRNKVRHTLPHPPQSPPACYTDDCRARQIITI
jgi:hypothetical protein